MQYASRIGAGMIVLLTCCTSFAQQLKLGNNPSTIAKSAVLELNSTNQGLLFTRIADTALINALGPPDGTVIYFTPLQQLMIRTNGSWQGLIGSSSLQNYWSVTGNSGTLPATNFIGTTDGQPLAFRTNNTEVMRAFSGGGLAIGATALDASNPEELLVDAGPGATSFNVISGKGTINNYLQLNIQNRSNGNTASSDLVATADNGTEALNFVDLGINSSGFTNTGFPIIGGANNAYLYSTGNDFILGNATAAKNLRFFTGGYALANERLRIDGSGNVGVGVTAPGNLLEVAGTNTSTGVSGLRLTNLGTATVATANSKVLSVNNTGDVIVTNNPGASNWLITGNSGINAATNFIGNIDDKALVFRSNNLPYLEFGRRQTLGLVQAYPDYTDPDEKVLHIRSALQFEAAGASFYKPKMFVDANGNFRLKGSAAGTDYFEMGSTGTSNNGGFDFIVGDDGTEPIVFKSYNFSTGLTTETMRLQNGRMAIGTSTFDATNPEKVVIDAGTTTSVNALYAKGTINKYFQINIQNLSSGTQSSSDLVATANNGTESTNFVNLGINGAGFVYQSGNPIETGKANDCYLIGSGNDLYIVNNNAAKDMIFLAGGTAATNEAMRITSTERIGIGTTTPSTNLHLKTGTTDDSGLRLENLTSSSATTTTGAILGIDATGKVVRAKRPVYYSGTGASATVDAVTKVWVADVANTATGIQTITIPGNVGFATILNIQVTAKGGSGPADAPIAIVTSNTTSTVIIRVLESAGIILGGEALVAHTDTNTRIFIRVEGN